MTRTAIFSNLSVVKLLFKRNYLTQIENFVKGENHLFRNFFVEKGGKIEDSLEDGRNSCAVMVSHILYSFNSLLEFLNKERWIKFIHLTVDSTEKDMTENGWHEISDLRPGAILIWEKKDGRSGMPHNHIGFFVGGETAVSNDSKGTGFPTRHHITYNDTRKIEKIYWHPELDE